MTIENLDVEKDRKLRALKMALDMIVSCEDDALREAMEEESMALTDSGRLFWFEVTSSIKRYYCQHIDYALTLDGGKCNDCGMDLAADIVTVKHVTD